MSHHPACPGRIPWDKGDKRQGCGLPVERLKYGSYAALCTQCNEMEYSIQWTARSKADGADLNALLAERGRWERAGHTFRGLPDRTHVDRRAGPQ